jgi:molecular chaperone GrpE
VSGDSGSSPGYSLRDRRWWVSPDEAGTAYDEGPEATPEERAPTHVAKLEAELADRDRRLREALVRERQALLEVDRARARIERDARQEIERSRRDLIVELLPVLDDLDRAIAAGKSAAPGHALATGIELVRSGFLDRLRALGIERFDPTGERFDPAKHEAVSTVVATPPDQGGLITKTLRPGYRAGNEILRPAQVIVTGRERRS